jgi:hypothetical protein
MSQRAAATMPHRGAVERYAGPEMWVLALATVVLAIGALLIVMWKPEALGLALLAGLAALGARALYTKVKESARKRAEASSAVANAGLAIAAVSIAPLLLFAFLWAALLVLLGVMWILSALGVI